MPVRSAKAFAKTPVQTRVTHDIIESANGAFTAANLAKKTIFRGDITGKIYLRAVHGSETPHAVQFYFEHNPSDKHKGELLRISSRADVHLLNWKQVNDSQQAELNAAAWVTVQDGHDFAARVMIRITVNRSRPDADKEIEVFLSADNRRYDRARVLDIAVPCDAGLQGGIRMQQRVPLAA